MQHQGFDGTYYLRNAEGKPVQIGDVVTDRWADSWTVDGGAAPHTSASTGKVYVTHTVENYQRTFYPSVLDLKWVLQSELSVAVDAAVAIVTMPDFGCVLHSPKEPQ